MIVVEVIFLCELNTQIRVDGKRLGIPNYQMIELDQLYHEENGYKKPESFMDLLDVVC